MDDYWTRARQQNEQLFQAKKISYGEFVARVKEINAKIEEIGRVAIIQNEHRFTESLQKGKRAKDAY